MRHKISLVMLVCTIGALHSPASMAQSAPTISQLVAMQERGSAPALRQERATLKQTVPPSPDFRPARQVRVEIDWAAAKNASLNFTRSKRIPNRRLNKAQINGVDMPVLMPEKLPANAKLMGKDYFYHGITREDGYSLSIHGTCILTELQSPGDPKTASTGLHIFQTEDGMAASFSLFGAAYSVLMVCDDPAGDKRCKSAAFMRQTVDGLIVHLGDRS